MLLKITLQLLENLVMTEITFSITQTQYLVIARHPWPITMALLWLSVGIPIVIKPRFTIFRPILGQRLQIIPIMTSKLTITLHQWLNNISVSITMQLWLHHLVYSFSEAMALMVMNMALLNQLLHVSTTQNGASLMVYNHLDMHIGLLWMKKRSLLLAEATISKSQSKTALTIHIKLQTYWNMELRWRILQYQACAAKTHGIFLLSRAIRGWCWLLYNEINHIILNRKPFLRLFGQPNISPRVT